MPQKKRGGSDADSAEGSTTSAPKRQRVSLACDACRTAREKCDGGKPTCGTCVAQSRTCSYTPTSKKRGVQTGYLRTIELSLAWLFDNVPESEKALHRLLASSDGADGGSILKKTDKSSNRLHKKWGKSRVHKEIGRLLSDDRIPRTDNSADDSDSDGDAGDENGSALGRQWSNGMNGSVHEAGLDTSRHNQGSPLKLPRNWRRLIGIYFSYTHCWLPILDQDTLNTTAASYPPEGIILEANLSAYTTSCHAELWAALAVAAFQDPSSHPTPDTSSPSAIYSIARSLVPSEGSTYQIPHLRALLLHSLVLIGRGSGLEAWLLVGKATRLTLHKHSTGKLYPEGGHMESSLGLPGTRLFAACFLFDTLTSLWLGQPPYLKASVHDLLPHVSMMDSSPAAVQAWTPVSGLGQTPQDHDTSSQPPAQPLLTFHQLYRFSRILNANAESNLHQCSSSRRVTPDDLVKSLDPQFGFCNSLIFGGSTPVVPSAFLLQTTFLATTVELVAGHRASLLSSFMEVVDSCVSNFSAHGTSPITVALLGIVQRGGHVDSLHEPERNRWMNTLDALKAVWKPSAANESAGKLYYGTPHHPSAASAQAFTHSLLTPTYQDGHDGPGVTGYTIPPVDQPADGGSHYLPYERRGLAGGMASAPSPAQPPARSMPSGNMPFQSPPLGRGQQTAMLYSSGMASQHIDYDAILEELGSIDCTDNIEVDPQFMTNLGFTPGYNLGEMFQEDFGV